MRFCGHRCFSIQPSREEQIQNQCDCNPQRNLLELYKPQQRWTLSCLDQSTGKSGRKSRKANHRPMRRLRLIVKTTKVGGDGHPQFGITDETCLVDVSGDFDSVIRQISAQVGFDVERLSLFTFKDGHVVAISAIKSQLALQDQDVLLAFRRGEGGMSGVAEGSNSTAVVSPSPSNTTDGREIQSSFRQTSRQPLLMAPMDESLSTHDETPLTPGQVDGIGGIVWNSFRWFGQLFRIGSGRISCNIPSNVNTPVKTIPMTPTNPDDAMVVAESERNPHPAGENASGVDQINNNYPHPEYPLHLLASLADAPNDEFTRNARLEESHQGYHRENSERGHLKADHEELESNEEEDMIEEDVHDDDEDSDESSTTSESAYEEIDEDESHVGDEENESSPAKLSYRGRICKPERLPNKGFQEDEREPSQVAKLNQSKNKRKRGRPRGPHPENLLAPLLSAVQRRKLETEEFKLEDFESYLIEEAKLGVENVQNIVNKVDLLWSGEGITYKYWGDDVVFYAEPPIKDMSTNFYQIRNNAYYHEDIYGKDRSNGWLIRNSIRKLEHYQVFCYKNLSTIPSIGRSSVKSVRKGNLGTQKNHSHALASSNPKYKVGTKVRKNFGPYGFWDGHIFTVDTTIRKYGIRFTDGDQRFYDFDDPQMDSIVDLYKKRNHSEQSSKKDNSRDKVEGRPPKKAKSTVRRIRGQLMDAKQREKLRGIPIDMHEFENYLQRDGIGQQTLGRVLRTVSILLSDKGIAYREWPAGVTFHPEPLRDLSVDFHQLIEDSVEFEERYGRDGSKGWLMRLPLQKLKKYQLYFYKNKLSQYKGQPIRHRLLLS